MSIRNFLRTSVAAVLTLLSLSAFSQQPTYQISKKSFDSLVRKGFNQMVSGQNDAPGLANYAAFNPTDGKFTFNGFHNIKNVVALNLSVTGGLISENVGSLFEDGKVNKNTDVTLKIHIRLDEQSLQFDASDFGVYNAKRSALETEKQLKWNAIISALNSINYRIGDLNAKLVTGDARIAQLKTDSTGYATANAFESLIVTTNLLKREYEMKIKRIVTIDSLNRISQVDALTRQQLQQKPTQLTPAQQHLVVVYSLQGETYRWNLYHLLDKEYDKKIQALECQIPVQSWDATWLTVIGNWNRKVYRTFDKELAFAQQIQKHDFNAFNYGIELNDFHFDRGFKRAWFTNIGFMRKENINLEDLNTGKVTDTDTASMGSVNREAKTEYTVYTDSIAQYDMWNLYANEYLVLGKKMSHGIHLGFNAEFRDNSQNVFDATIGYFFGFFNKSDKRIINTEVFMRFNDLTDEVDTEDVSFFKQTQIGISIAVPILTIK